MCDMRDIPRELFELLHTLWSHDVGSRGYDKAKWKRLEAYLYAIIRFVPEGASVRPPD